MVLSISNRAVTGRVLAAGYRSQCHYWQQAVMEGMSWEQGWPVLHSPLPFVVDQPDGLCRNQR